MRCMCVLMVVRVLGRVRAIDAMHVCVDASVRVRVSDVMCVFVCVDGCASVRVRVRASDAMHVCVDGCASVREGEGD